MNHRLDQMCAEYDRTATMGPFPTVGSAVPLVRGENRSALISDAASESNSVHQRDNAMWSLVYTETLKDKTRDLGDMLYSTATSAKEPVLRRSSAWALFKLGEAKLLLQTLRSDDDGNVHSWKQHLIYESQGRTDWIDPRPVRRVDSKLGYAMTLPLTIHGVVLFRTHNPEKAKTFPASRSSATAISPAAVPGYLGGGSQTAPSYATSNPGAYDWHSLAAGPTVQRQLVGDLTASVGQGAIYENLIIQKVVNNPLGDGNDHVQGYLFKGMSRVIGGNVFAHYYTSSGPQPYYLSGRIGDASEGVIDVETQLVRTAETHLVSKSGIDYPYVQSVRGLFYGPARMDPAVAFDASTPLDNRLQIIKDPYANGWFFGEFRSVPVDVDGDGTVEINGMEMYTDLSGRVTQRTPTGPQKSLVHSR